MDDLSKNIWNKRFKPNFVAGLIVLIILLLLSLFGII